MTSVNSLRHVLFPFARWQHDHAQTQLPCETSMTRACAVATACRPWVGLTVCVYVDVHASGSRSLPCAVTLSSILMMPAARLVCQRPSSNFPYFRTPLASFLLSPARTPWNTVILKQLHCCPRLNVRVHSSKVELAAVGVHPIGMISLHASV